MNKVYHLSSCDTCRKILKSLPESAKTKSLVLQDIKAEPMTAAQVDEMAKLAGSYESLFSRKAMLYKSLGLKDQQLGEADYKKYILEHYTFLSRPVFVIDGKIYVGNSAKNVAAVQEALK